MDISKDKLSALGDMLSRPRKIVIVSHTNPDGDAIGSSIAWGDVLAATGHTVTRILPNRYPYYLDFMPGIREIIIHKNDTE